MSAMRPILHAMLCLMQEGFSKCWDALCLGYTKARASKNRLSMDFHISCMPGPFIAVAVLPPRSLGQSASGLAQFLPSDASSCGHISWFPLKESPLCSHAWCISWPPSCTPVPDSNTEALDSTYLGWRCIIYNPEG